MNERASERALQYQRAARANAKVHANVLQLRWQQLHCIGLLFADWAKTVGETLRASPAASAAKLLHISAASSTSTFRLRRSHRPRLCCELWTLLLLLPLPRRRRIRMMSRAKERRMHVRVVAGWICIEEKAAAAADNHSRLLLAPLISHLFSPLCAPSRLLGAKSLPARSLGNRPTERPSSSRRGSFAR